MLAFVAVLGLASVAMVRYDATIARREAEVQLLYVGAKYRLAFQSYARHTPLGQRQFPEKLTDLLSDKRTGVTFHHIRDLYPDPITKANDWRLIDAPGGGIMGVSSRSDLDAIKVSRYPHPFEYFDQCPTYSAWKFQFPDPIPCK
ncbi:MAG: type II secretion system protein [Burkholderiales bacterium]|nr:type II secretion system protein [Burkholderiales bacterium]